MKSKETYISHQAEEYLEAIYRLEKEKGCAKTMDLVKELGVVPGSITNTIEGLERRGLVFHQPYKGVKLTLKGLKIAINVIRKHRLAERLLTDFLHLDWSEVHDPACKLEHGLSPKILNSLEIALGHPNTCPHGNPIPKNNGEFNEVNSKPLTELEIGEGGVIEKIVDEKATTLRVLEDLGLFPNFYVKLKQKQIAGFLEIQINGKKRTVEHKLAKSVYVKPSIIEEGGNTGG